MRLHVLPLLSLLLFLSCQSKTNPAPAVAEPAPPPPPAVKPDPLAKLGEVTPPEAPEVENEPTDNEAEIQFRAAVQFYRQRKFEFAAAAFAEVVQLDRRRDDARLYLAVSLLCTGQAEQAIAPLTRLARNKDNEEAALLLAKAQIQRREFHEARRILTALDTEEARGLLEELNRLRGEL